MIDHATVTNDPPSISVAHHGSVFLNYAVGWASLTW